MELLTTISNWTGWPTVVIVLLLCGSLGVFLYSKNVEILRDKADFYEKKCLELEKSTPDILAERLSNHVTILEKELSRLQKDADVGVEIIKQKEDEIELARNEINSLNTQIEKAKNILQISIDNDLICPYCGAPLLRKEYHTISMVFDGKDFEDEIEYINYECGREIVNGVVKVECKYIDSSARN